MMDNSKHLLTGLTGLTSMQVVHDIDPSQLESVLKLGFQLIIGIATIIPLIKSLFKKKP